MRNFSPRTDSKTDFYRLLYCGRSIREADVDPIRGTGLGVAFEDTIAAYCTYFAQKQKDFAVEDVEDMQQEAYLAVLKWQAANPSEALGEGMLVRLLATTCSDYERTTRQQRMLVSRDTDEPSEDPAAAATQEDDAIILDYLEKIVQSPEEAQIALLCVYHGLSTREAAEELGLSQSRVARVMKALAERGKEL